MYGIIFVVSLCNGSDYVTVLNNVFSVFYLPPFTSPNFSQFPSVQNHHDNSKAFFYFYYA